MYDPTAPRPPVGGSQTLQGSPQTDALLALLELNHRVTIPYQPGAGAAAAAVAVADGGFFLDHGSGPAAPVDGMAASGGGGADPNTIDIDDLDGGGEGDGGDPDGGDNGNGEEAEVGGDTIVYEGTAAAAAPSKARPRLVLPPPSAP